MRVSTRLTTIILLIAMGLTGLSLSATGPVAAQAVTGQYVLVGSEGRLPLNLEALVASVGGHVVDQLDEIGVAIVQSSDPSFEYAAATIPGVQGVAKDRVVSLALPEVEESVVAETLELETAQIEGPGDTAAMFFPTQWNVKQIGAPLAWHNGFKGDPRVKVALLDTGIDYGQVDLKGKVDMSLSKSYIVEPLLNGTMPFMDMNGHGTHVAGIIGGNGRFIAGIAPQVTLIAVKVAGKNGSAQWSTIIEGIKYAADIGADVINMSFGDTLEKGGRESAQLMAALNRAVNYAHGKGALLVASAGNSGINWDRMGNSMKLPAQLPHVLAVSATGPQFGVSMDAMGVAPISGVLGTYTDFGMSIVNFAAPGGSATPFRPAIKMTMPNGLPITLNWPVDLITSTCSRAVAGCTSGSGVQARAGTSMAAAHVSAVAALVDSAAGGMLTGDQIMHILARSADDFGKSGKDEWYGYGRINAVRAVTGN